MRRFWAVALASALLSVTAVAGPANACGCGAIAPGVGAVAEVTGENAIVSFRDGVESIQLSLGVDSAITDAGLIIPTPTPATVSAGDPALFDAVADQTSPRKRFVDDWWGTKVATPTIPVEPTVVSRVDVGGLEATTLRASDSGALAGWLTQHGYTLSAETSAQLDHYVAKRWYFVAVSLASEATLDGTLDPIQVSFPTDTLVYPLAMARAAASEQKLRLNVFGEHRVSLVQAGTAATPLNAAQRTVWAGAVTSPALTALGPYLTVVDVRLDVPAVQVADDIGIALAPDDTAVDAGLVVVRPIELLGFPLGTLLTIWLGLGLVGLVGAIIARRRLR